MARYSKVFGHHIGADSDDFYRTFAHSFHWRGTEGIGFRFYWIKGIEAEEYMCAFLVVGGAGYIGCHMVRLLLERGHTVVVLDNLSTGHRSAVAGADCIEGDLGDKELLDVILSAGKIDCVMHFAAFSLVGESVQDPLRYYRNNLAKTIELVRAMREHGVDNFILSSTAAVYGEPETVPILETAFPNPTNPYGHSKVFMEQVLEDCRKAYGIKYVSLRYFNAAGAHEAGEIGEDHRPETHLIPLVLQVALGQRDSISIFGTDWDTPDGTCIRDYIHVDDLAEAHILAAQRIMDGGESAVYNLGCEHGYSVREIIEIARKVTGHPIPVREVQRRPGDPARLVASSEKIKSELGWRPRFDDPEEIIASAWKWHKNHPYGYTG
jgi:UDP-glucose 4-epimerase